MVIVSFLALGLLFLVLHLSRTFKVFLVTSIFAFPIIAPVTSRLYVGHIPAEATAENTGFELASGKRPDRNKQILLQYVMIN